MPEGDADPWRIVGPPLTPVGDASVADRRLTAQALADQIAVVDGVITVSDNGP